MSRKLYRNHADKFFNVAGTPVDSNTAVVLKDVGVVAPEPSTQPTNPADSTLVNNKVPYQNLPTNIRTAVESNPVEIVEEKPTPTTNVVVVQPVPVVTPAPPIVYTGGGGGGASSDKKLTAPVVKNSLIKTYLLPLLLIGAGVYVYFKKPITK